MMLMKIADETTRKVTLLGLLLMALGGVNGQGQTTTYLVDPFDPAGTGGYSYSGGQIGSVWGNWFGSAFQSLSWDSASDASNNPSSGSIKITNSFSAENNQFEVYNGMNGINPPLLGLQYTNFQCDVRFAAGSAKVTNGGVAIFGHLQFGTSTAANGQAYFGGNYGVDIVATNTNWVHISIPIDAVTYTNLQNIYDVMIHIYGPYYGSSATLIGTSTLWVDNIKFVGAAAVATNCVVDWNDVHQRIDGFGASSAWRSTWTTNMADVFFSTNNKIVYTNNNKTIVSTNNGIGLSLLRTRIAPGGTTVESSIMQMAQARGALVWSVPWSPQASFKSNTNVNGGGYKGSGANATNLAYARQLASYVVNMKNTYGVNLYALSIQNEPDAQVTTYESCNWTAQQIHDFTTNLYNALVASNVSSTKIMLPESQNWQDYSNLAATAMSDSISSNMVGIIADHNYDGLYGPASLVKNSYGKPLWETEVAILSGSDSSITNGVYYAQRIHQFLTVAEVNAWHYWWLVGYGSSNEGLMDTNANPTPRMFVLGQYSRFVRPGYYRIGVSNNTYTSISAYKDTNSSSFAIVAINPTSATVTQIFNLANFPPVASVTPWITSSNLSLASTNGVTVSNAAFAYTLPPLSVVTFVGQQSQPNSAPTDVSLSNTNVAENLPPGTAVGTFSTTDPDAGNTFTYSLVSGTGSTDNSSFTITNNTLYAAAAFNFEAQSSYGIRVRTTDQGGLYYEEAFTITVTNVNETPTDVSLSNSSVAENQSTGTAVGAFTTIDPDSGNTFTYTLISGTGSTDNNSFTITNDTLYTAAVFNYEVKSSYSLRVRTTDQGSLYAEKVFAITVANVNETPVTPVNISPANGAANQSPALALQSSVFSDPDSGDTHAASEWLVWLGSTNVFDSGTDSVNKTNRAMSAGALNYGTAYTWQVRYQDNHGLWGGYSAATAFSTLAPRLDIASQGADIVLIWPTNTAGFVLEWTTNLPATGWTPASPSPSVVDGQNVVTNLPANDVQFYRLRKP
jgi:O-glycosyl hydrolase